MPDKTRENAADQQYLFQGSWEKLRNEWVENRGKVGNCLSRNSRFSI